MPTLEFLVTVLIGMDLVLFLLMAIVFARVARMGPRRVEELITQLKESQRLAHRLEKLLNEKAKLVKTLENRLLKTDGKDRQQARVMLLRESGLDAGRIAEITGLTTGEVELILSIESVSASRQAAGSL